MIDCLKQLESEIHQIPREYLPALLQIVKAFRSAINLKSRELYEKRQFGQFRGQIEIADDFDEPLQIK